MLLDDFISELQSIQNRVGHQIRTPDYYISYDGASGSIVLDAGLFFYSRGHRYDLKAPEDEEE